MSNALQWARVDGIHWGVRYADADALRVLVVGEDRLARSGISLLLAGQWTRMVGERSPEEDWAGAAAAEGAQAVVMDLPEDARLPEPALSESPAPVVALVSDADAALAAASSGAKGVLRREVDAGQLVAALRSVVGGLTVLDSGFLPALLRERVPVTEALTPRELEVLQLLSQGLANKVIAQRLSISEHTAKFHVNAILSKLGAQSRTDAVVRAARQGLVVL